MKIDIPIFDLRHPKSIPGRKNVDIMPGGEVYISNRFGEITVKYLSRSSVISPEDMKTFWAVFNLTKCAEKKGEYYRIPIREVVAVRGLKPKGDIFKRIRQSLIKLRFVTLSSNREVWTELGKREQFSLNGMISDIIFDITHLFMGGQKEYFDISFGAIYREAILHPEKRVAIPGQILKLSGMDFNLAVFLAGQSLKEEKKHFNTMDLLTESLFHHSETARHQPWKSKRIYNSLERLKVKKIIKGFKKTKNNVVLITFFTGKKPVTLKYETRDLEVRTRDLEVRTRDLEVRSDHERSIIPTTCEGKNPSNSLSNSFLPKEGSLKEGRKEKRELLSEFNLYPPILEKALESDFTDLVSLICYSRHHSPDNPAKLIAYRIQHNLPVTDHELKSIQDMHAEKKAANYTRLKKKLAMSRMNNGGLSWKGQPVKRISDAGITTDDGLFFWGDIRTEDLA